MSPVLPNLNFRWRGKYYHLTYKGHIAPGILLQRLSTITSVKVLASSVAQEVSDAEAPYDHTHLAWVWEKGVDLVGCGIMDINVGGQIVHPNIENKKAIAWMERVFTQYHKGWKVGGDGKLNMVAPILLQQNVPVAWEWGDFVNTEVMYAEDLLAGVCAAGIRPKTVLDVLTLMNNKRPRPFEHNFSRDQFRPQSLPVAYLVGQVGTLQIYGGVGLGKTEWACAQFSNPLYVTARDVLKSFVPNFHDGIILDKMKFTDWSVTDAESLTDFTQPAQIRVRYGLALIPKNTRKIVVTNAQDVWPEDPFGQIIGRRVAQMYVASSMY